MAEPPFTLKREEILAYIKIESMRGKKALAILMRFGRLTQSVLLDIVQ